MKRKQAVIEVKILLDPIPGWGHNPEDYVKLLLNAIPEWYKPEVKLLRVQAVED